MLLIGRQPVHPVLAQNAMHGRRGDRQLVKALQVVGDLARAEVVVLPQVQNLADDLRRRGSWRPVRRARPVAQAAAPCASYRRFHL